MDPDPGRGRTSGAFVVGIDLGTTNTVVASAEASGRAPAKIFDVEQRVDAATIDARPLLPSVLFFQDGEWIVGEHARRRGVEVEGKSVASAKSWLAHAGVDRSAPILPWGADDGTTEKISPIEAQARILAHVRDAWDRAHPDAPLAEQSIVLTVPASFDEIARTLTVEATKRAGLPSESLRLFEEPQAAFLDWAREGTSEAGLRDLLGDAPYADVLVCDVGGGTSDFSLIRATRGEEIALERVAVGDHLLLGGDNMDIALAHRVESRITPEGERLAPGRFAQLVQAARAAKEQLFSRSGVDETTVTLLGGGSRLVGGARKATLTRREVEETVLEGFFPLVTRESLEASRAARRGRTGLVAFGLPYAADAAITRQLAAFLSRARDAGSSAPIALLLNGGVFHAEPIAARIVDAVEAFLGVRPTLLPQVDPDLAVARGAVAHGLALRGFGRRIGGGSAHGYYVGVSGTQSTNAERRAVCVVPRGAEAAHRHVARGRTFALVVGRPARFELFASASATHHAGDVVDVGADDFTLLVPLVTKIEGDRSNVREAKVELRGELTEIGTLDLACVEVDTGRAHRLSFELRAAPTTVPPPSTLRPGDRRLEEAAARIDRVFGKSSSAGDPRDARSLVRDLEKLLGEKSTWPTAIVRPLFDVVRAGFGSRRRSADHERAFWSLAGFLLRPGYGDPLDAQRVAVLEPLFAQRLAFPSEAANWRAWWIAWRRIAGGLAESAQIAIRDLIDPFVSSDDVRLKKQKGVRAEPFDEVLLLASSLERLPVSRRAELGGWLVDRTWTAPPNEASHLYAAVGRIGARIPAHASAHHVVPPKVVEPWIEHVLRADFKSINSLSFALVQLARTTGDRARDVSDRVRKAVASKLEQVGARAEWIAMVRELVALDDAQKREMFGEALPLGLRLVD